MDLRLPLARNPARLSDQEHPGSGSIFTALALFLPQALASVFY